MYPEFKEPELTLRLLKGWQFNRNTHGSLFDRGSADSYYGRPQDPHYGGVGGESGVKVTELTQEEIRDYLAGYSWNEHYGDKKAW